MKQSKKGFTLVELMIVIVIIGILAAIIIPSVSSAIERANVANDTSNLTNMNKTLAIEAITKNRAWFEAYEVLDIIHEAGYKAEVKQKDASFWYNRETNAIEVMKDADVRFAGASPKTPVEEASAAGKIYPLRIESVLHDTKYLYVSEEKSELNTAISAMQNLLKNAKEDKTNYSDICTNLGTKFNEAQTAAKSVVEANGEDSTNYLAKYLENFSPAKNIYADDSGMYTTINEDSISNNTLKAERIIIAGGKEANLTKINFAFPDGENGASENLRNATVSVNNTFSIPATVTEVKNLDTLAANCSVLIYDTKIISGLTYSCQISSSPDKLDVRTIGINYSYIFDKYNYDENGNLKFTTTEGTLSEPVININNINYTIRMDGNGNWAYFNSSNQSNNNDKNITQSNQNGLTTYTVENIKFYKSFTRETAIRTARQDSTIMIPLGKDGFKFSADISSLFSGVSEDEIVIGDKTDINEGTIDTKLQKNLEKMGLHFTIKNIANKDGTRTFIVAILYEDNSLFAYGKVTYIEMPYVELDGIWDSKIGTDTYEFQNGKFKKKIVEK